MRKSAPQGELSTDPPGPSTGSARRTYGQAVQLPKAADLVSSAIRNQIVRGELKEGERLPPEAVLMHQFGVSRPTLREAVRILESEQLVTVRRGAHGGAIVHRPTPDLVARHAGFLLQHTGATLADVYQARVIFEPACARMVAENRTVEDIELLRETVEHERQIIHEVHDLAAKAGFHRVLVRLSGNQTLILLNEMLRDILLKTAAKELQRSGIDQAVVVKAHRELVDLIERGDGEAAQEHWRAHLQRTTDRVLKQLGGRTTVLDVLSGPNP